MKSKSHRNLLIIIGILSIFSITLSLFARRTPTFPGDLSLTLILQSNSNETLALAMKWASILFTSWPADLMVFLTGLILWWRIGRLEGVLVWGAGLFSLINEVFKWAVARPRPSAEQVKILMAGVGYGYPSGHAFFSILFLGTLAFFLFAHLQNQTLRMTSLIILILLILLVGTSRVYLGDHWPSDVLGGYVLGGLFLEGLIWFYEKLKPELIKGKVKK